MCQEENRVRARGDVFGKSFASLLFKKKNNVTKVAAGLKDEGGKSN